MAALYDLRLDTHLANMATFIFIAYTLCAFVDEILMILLYLIGCGQ